MKDTMLFYARFCLAIACSLLLPAAAHAVVTSDAPKNHVVTPGEPAYGVNLDGVALLGFAAPNPELVSDLLLQCTGSLISDRHVLSAAHCFDTDGDDVVDGNITGFPFAENAIIAGFELPDRTVFLDVKTESIVFPPQWRDSNADIAVMELTEPAPAELPRYRVYSLSDEVGKPIVIAGYGMTGHGSTGAADNVSVKHAGLNRYEAHARSDFLLAFDFDSGLPENNHLGQDGYESDLGFGIDEVNSASGDSGGPTFINGAIAGVQSYGVRRDATDVNGVNDSSWGEVSFDTRLSLQQDFLVEATGGQVVFVPEPSAWLLMLTGALLVGWRQGAMRQYKHEAQASGFTSGYKQMSVRQWISIFDPLACASCLYYLRNFGKRSPPIISVEINQYRKQLIRNYPHPETALAGPVAHERQR